MSDLILQDAACGSGRLAMTGGPGELLFTVAPPMAGGPPPGFALSSQDLMENSPDNTIIGVASYPNAVGPTNKRLTNILPAGTLRLVGDQLRAGPTPVDYETDQTIAADFLYDDGGVTHTFPITVTVHNMLAPANTAKPSLTGTLKVGQDLTGSDGSWDGSPTSYTYKWGRSDTGNSGWTDISGAKSAVYTLTAADDGKYIRRGVAASNGEGASGSSWSSASAQITYPAPSAAGGLTDRSYVQGSGNQTVDAAPDFTGAVGGTWSVTGGGATISASGVVTLPSTTVQTGTVVTVTYTNSGGSASSAFQMTVTSAPAVPAAMAAPGFTGVTTSGFTVVRAAAPSDGGSAITSYDLRWSADAGSTWTTVTGIGASQAITGRAAGTAHLVQTRAVSSVGAGAWGASGSVTTAAGDTTAPVITAASYDSGTSTLSMSITEATSLPCTLHWVGVYTGMTPSAAQIEAGSGGGILQAGTVSLGDGANAFSISLTDTNIKELHFVVKDGAGNSSGTPSAAAHTIITGITVAASAPVAVGYATATGTAATYTVPLTGLTGWDGAAGGDAQVGDFALMISGFADTTDQTPGVNPTASPDWFNEENLYVYDIRACNLGVDWKVLTAADITAGTVTVNGSGNTGKGGASILLAIRGQSGTPFRSKGVAATGIDGDAFDPPSLVTTAADSFTFCIGASTRAANASAVGTPGTGATEIIHVFSNTGVRAFFVAVAFVKGQPAGTTVDQAARTGTPANTADSWCAQTIEVA